MHEKGLQRQIGVGTLVSSQEQRALLVLVIPVESKTRTYHGRVGSERPAERPVGVGQDWVPTEIFAQETSPPFPPRHLRNVALTSLHLSSPKPGHTPGGTVRGGARRDGGAGRGQAAQDADDGTVRPGENKLSYPLDDGRMTSWVCLWKHELGKSYVNRWRNKTRG